MHGSDSAVDLDYEITHLTIDDLRSSDFPIYHTFMPYQGIFPFSIEICRSSWSHTILTTHRMRDELIVYCYLIMIPQWSLSWVIQSGSHFSTFRYHHASYFRKRLLDVWVRFNCGFGWQRSHIWWWMIWCCLIFGLFHVWFHTGAYFLSG